VSALFEADTARDATLAALRGLLGGALPAGCRWELVADRAWEREWLQYFEPRRFGERLWVGPEAKLPPAAQGIVLRLDPGLAFGTGTHPTTALCLEWLDAHPPAGLEVIDYGCGSGILGIAALLLGARHLNAVDIDPQAVLATRDNAARNDIDPARFAVGEPAMLDGQPPARLLLANILAAPLQQLAPRFAQLLPPGATALLSGVLTSQAEGVVAAYLPWFELRERSEREQWCRIELRRSGRPADARAAMLP